MLFILTTFKNFVMIVQRNKLQTTTTNNKRKGYENRTIRSSVMRGHSQKKKYI